MAYRKTYSRSRKSNILLSDYVPFRKQSQTDTVNLIFNELMGSIGVIDVKSYFERLSLPIALCVVVGAVYGANSEGLSGLIWGGLAGLAAPAALLWFAIIVCYRALILGVYFAAWAAIIFGVFWLANR